MKNNDNEIKDIEIPDSTLQAIKNAMDSYKKTMQSMGSFFPNLKNINIPKIDIPNFKIPFEETTKFTMPPDPNIVREDNEWKRHKQLLDTQNAILEIQKLIFEEQKSTTVLTKWVLALTVLGLLITVALSGISK